LYRRGAYLPEEYREALRRRAAPLVAKHGLHHRRAFTASGTPVVETAGVSQPTLF
jgi:hypothetical protein